MGMVALEKLSWTRRIELLGLASVQQTRQNAI